MYISLLGITPMWNQTEAKEWMKQSRNQSTDSYQKQQAICVPVIQIGSVQTIIYPSGGNVACSSRYQQHNTEDNKTHTVTVKEINGRWQLQSLYR